jgi:hypothetical protein
LIEEDAPSIEGTHHADPVGFPSTQDATVIITGKESGEAQEATIRGLGLIIESSAMSHQRSQRGDLIFREDLVDNAYNYIPFLTICQGLKV